MVGYIQAVSGGTDVLTLSATPIPRTLQMSMANLRDLSLMNTAPVGRKEVNVTVTDEDGDVIRRAIQAEVARQGQVFVVVPFVRDVAPTHERYVLFYDYAYPHSLCSAILPHCSLTQLSCPSLL